VRTPIHNLEAKLEFAAQMRKKPTPAEAALWERLRKKQTGFVFHRQSLQRGYILDFYCPHVRLAIEIDGSIHDAPERAAIDGEKEQALTDQGIKVLRFTNQDVLDFPMVAMLRIETTLKALAGGWGCDGERERDVSSSSRACESSANYHTTSNKPADWSGVKAVLSSYPNLCRPKEIPDDQRATLSDAKELTDAFKKLVKFDRQRSLAFSLDNRTSAERAFDQKYRLQQWLKKKAQETA
jgi:very-short-patch-repair endonuclease